MSAHQRAVFVAQHPDAAARAFDAQIKAFLHTIVRYRRGTGLFGRCKAYYGMVEVQGRGTLHCHMLLWLGGSPNPQLLRDRFEQDESFQANVFQWLEDIIKCELPGMSEPLKGVCGRLMSNVEEQGEQDVRLLRAPQISLMEAEDFAYRFCKFVKDLAVTCNWHHHTGTCFKHLEKGQPRTDGNCCMRISGQTRTATSLDPDTSSILLCRLHPWINNYNDVVLFLLQCNMDIKFIGSGPAAKALVYYITDYITKNNLHIHAGLQMLQAAICSHAEKFRDDSSMGDLQRD